MLSKLNEAKKTASDVLADLRPYLATLAHDEKLRRRLVAAVAGRVVTRRRSTTQALWGQIVEVVSGCSGRSMTGVAKEAPQPHSPQFHARARRRKRALGRTPEAAPLGSS